MTTSSRSSTTSRDDGGWRSDAPSAASPSCGSRRATATLAAVTTTSPATLARELYRAGRWADAARVARVAAQRDPSFAEDGAVIVGLCRLREGRAEEARAALEYALSRNPRSSTLRLAFAEAALASGDDEACASALDGLTADTADAEELRAALRRTRRELPVKNAMAGLAPGRRLATPQWEEGVMLLLRAGLAEDAAELVARRPAGAAAPLARLLAARTATARADREALPLWRSVVADDVAHAAEAVDAALALDAFEDAKELARRAHEALGDSLALGRLALYGGRFDEARRQLLDALPSGERRSLLAALELASGNPARARELLEASARAPADELMYVETLRRLGDIAGAEAHLNGLPPTVTNRVAAAPLCRMALTSARDVQHKETSDVLTTLRRDFPDLAPLEDHVAFAHGALDALSGNWSPRATRRTAQGEVRAQAVTPPLRARLAALREGLSGLPFEAIMAQHDALDAREGPHPLVATYGAELLLWRGEYERAAEWIARALARDQLTRWAYVGRAILENATDRPTEALATLAHQRQLMPPLPNSLACTAEAYLRLGDGPRAQRAYEQATDAHPTRTSAYVGLAGALTLQERDPAWALQRVRAISPVFYSQWMREAPGDDVLAAVHHALHMMRGNRGSGLITWYTADGAFHGDNATPSA